MNPDVSIIIPAYNASATLGAQLDAITAQAPPTAEILVVDNNSTDGTRALVETYGVRDPRVRVIVAADGRGPSYARNCGAAAARADTMLFCDADDVVAAGWCSALVTALADHDFVGGPLDVDELNPPWLADGRGRWGVGKPGIYGSVTFAHGCNLGIRRQCFLDAGGLDERLFAGEEIDLALRLKARGIAMHFVPEAVVAYRYRADLPALARQAYAYGRVVPALNRTGATVPGFVPERASARRALWLIRNLFALLDRAGRVRWTWLAASQAGRLAGRIRRGPR